MCLSLFVGVYLCSKGWGVGPASSHCCSDNRPRWAACGSDHLVLSRRRSSSGEHMPEHTENTQTTCDKASLLTITQAAQRCYSHDSHNRNRNVCVCVCARLMELVFAQSLNLKPLSEKVKSWRSMASFICQICHMNVVTSYKLDKAAADQSQQICAPSATLMCVCLCVRDREGVCVTRMCPPLTPGCLDRLTPSHWWLLSASHVFPQFNTSAIKHKFVNSTL